MMRVLEANAPPKQTATDTISTLSSRLASATLLEDRRAAILGLRSFAKEYPASVASGALRGLIAALTQDGEDVDTLKVVLETLIMLFHPDEQSVRLISSGLPKGTANDLCSPRHLKRYRSGSPISSHSAKIT
ncbi:hypothetical protein BDU57DRAFT_103827 [Ampelomyces quisqualis]|uniref:MMS19 nucleotide excision repair protein n=1 Tax=Ampelomyces quisqualis TaxID=50730 RepID=A0A6A5Q7D4_AMPQU|nr:hypothetical protein BDU57DRAFT_103827 [Ampelomyces quisqualis]